MTNPRQNMNRLEKESKGGLAWARILCNWGLAGVGNIKVTFDYIMTINFSILDLNYEADPAPIQPFIPSEAALEIDQNRSRKKAPGCDQITGRMI